MCVENQRLDFENVLRNKFSKSIDLSLEKSIKAMFRISQDKDRKFS